MNRFLNRPLNLLKTTNVDGEPDDEVTNGDIEIIAKKCLNIALVPLTLVCLHPIKFKVTFLRCVGFVYTVWVLVLYYWTALYITHYPITITKLCELISSFGLYTLFLLKVIPLVYYNHIIIKLIKSEKRFWKATDPDLKKKILELYKASHYNAQLFQYLVLSTLAMFMARPFYDPGTVLTIQWFSPKYYYHALAYQTFYAFWIVATVLGFNLLFLVFITHMRAQFLILNWKIENHNYDGTINDMKVLQRYVKHHRFLLSYVKDIEKVFMIQLLALYCLTIGSCCMELYSIAEAPTTLVDKGRSVIYLISLNVQLALFCFPAGELTGDILRLSDSFYMGKWEDASRAMQTWLPFAIHSTQQVVDFKALGLITINKMAFIDVAKSTVSFLTLMRNMNDK